MRYLHLYARQQRSPILQALSELVTGAFFFACRSCEYLSVTVRGKTKILCLKNIKFTTENYQEINQNDPALRNTAFYVSITFESQKNNVKNEKITQQRSNDATLCPVRTWAETVSRIRSYPKTNDDTPVNYYVDGKSASHFSQKSLNIFLRETVKQKPHLHFGYDHTTIGTHSIRSGAAMALYLADAPPHKIMLLGRWCSDAFLLYLRPEVLSSFSSLSSNMVQTEDFSHTSASTNKKLENETRHKEDTLRRGDTRSIIQTRAVNINGAEKPSNVHIPQFHLVH
jgi:hypothetical protein